mgnify:CR=1 FL=1
MESAGIITSDELYHSEQKYGDFTEANVWEYFKTDIKNFDKIMTALQTKMKNTK